MNCPRRWNVTLFGGVFLLAVVEQQPCAAQELTFLSAPHQTEVQLTLALPGPLPADLAGRIDLWPVGRPKAITSVPVVAGVVPPFIMPEGQPFELRAAVAGTWSFHQVVNLKPGERQRSHTIRLWPLGILNGALKLSKRPQVMPKEIEARMEPPPLKSPSGELPWGSVRCPIEQGVFSCQLPAARLNLSFRLAGYAPAYRWGFEVKPGEAQALGALELRPGGSVAGWVEMDGAPTTQEPARVRLARVAVTGGSAESRAVLQRGRRQEPVGSDGFFQLVDLEPGTYNLEAIRPGFGPARLAAIDIAEDQHLLLDQPLRLGAIFDLAVQVNPPLDWGGKPWQVEVSRTPQTEAEKDLAKPRRAAVAADGLAALPELTPGLFSLTVLDAAGNSFYAEHELALGGQGAVSHLVELAPITAEGRVRYGETPVEGTLWFGGKSGAVRVGLPSDENGEFHGTLPRAGGWRVDVVGRRPSLELKTRAMLEANHEGMARVELEIPATEVFGRVVDEEGHGVEGAKVVLAVGQEWFEQVSSPKAEFRFLGVPSGIAAVIAERHESAGRQTSERATTALREDEENGPLTLTLRKTQRLRGVVRAEQGPVLGAQIFLQAHRPKLGFGSNAQTLEGGEFSAEVPAQATALLAVVVAPGFGLRAAELEVSQQPAMIQLSSMSGALEVRLPMAANELADRALSLVILQDGLQLAHGLLFNWARAHSRQFLLDDQSLAVPALAPGHYRACLAEASTLTDWDFTGTTLPSSRCAEGFLGAGSTLRLRVP